MDGSCGVGHDRVVITPRQPEYLPFGACCELGAERYGVQPLRQGSPDAIAGSIHLIARTQLRFELGGDVSPRTLTPQRGRKGTIDVRTSSHIRAMPDGVDRDQYRGDHDHGEHDVLHAAAPPFLEVVGILPCGEGEAQRSTSVI